ncbi:MAG: gluconeogenesis factor YvcK family protein [Acidimicrobiales bacterium]
MTDGVRVVAIGGGHGLAATLCATRRYATDVTAIVSVADDGGSSGRLRAELGIPAPGDLRKCLVALADPTSRWARAFEHRFSSGPLRGHALGNLVIAGLAEATGSFETALAVSGRLLGSAGQVLPSTREAVVLKATAGSFVPHVVQGQVNVANTDRITGVSLMPADADPPRAAIEAVARADQIVIGPGSLFTSLLAAVVVPALRDALAGATGRIVYVCNLRQQVPETAGYDAAAHVAALEAHGVHPDVVLCHPGALPRGNLQLPCVEAVVAGPGHAAHDPALLAAALSGLV